MQGGADPGGRVKGVNQAHDPGEQVLPGKGLRPQILDAGIDDVAEHGQDLGDDDIGLDLFEAGDVIEEGVDQRAEHQQVPAPVEDHKELVEGDQVVQSAVDQVAALGRDQVFRDKVHGKIKDPARQELCMGKTGLVQPTQGKPAVINRLSLHGYRPPGVCFSDNAFWRRWDRGPPGAPAAEGRCG